MNSINNKYLIETGIGLQDVDKLKNSTYFLNETNRYIKGEISLNQLDSIINSYYESKPIDSSREEEADKVSIRITKLLLDKSFSLNINQLLSIHRVLFDGLLEHPGEFRKYNISKKEWVLNGESVIYSDFRDIEKSLSYDFNEEKKFSYKGRSIDEIIEHLALFIANLWQIHGFSEGNTRTIAVFFIKYLRTLGFNVTNDTFIKYSWYFRNSLVRANYNDLSKNIYADYSFLNKFLKNLLLNEHNVLLNRELHVNEVNRTNETSTKETKIISLIKENPYITTSELSMKIGVSIRTIKNILKVLKDTNKIKRINGKRYGYWKI